MPRKKRIDFRSRELRKGTRGKGIILRAANGEEVNVDYYLNRPRPKWSEPLDDREWRFVEEYLVDLNQKRAAVRAGLGSNNNSAACMASALMKRPHVARAIDAAISSTSGGAVRTRIIDELAAMAFHNPGDYFSFGPKGVTLIDSKLLTKEQLLSVRKVKQVKGKSPSIEMELADKGGALKMLGQAVGLGKEGASAQVNVQINVSKDDDNL